MPTPTPTPGNSGKTVAAGAGAVNGLDDTFTPTDGDLSGGGVGQAIAGSSESLTCDTTMADGPAPPNYHVHVFLGLYANGQEIAMPDGFGMKNPGADITAQGFPNQTEYAGCFYHLHMHDPSGLLHLEDPNPNQVPQTGTMFTLGDALKVWGAQISPLGQAQIGPYQGQAQVYTSGQFARGGTSNGFVGSSTYTLYGGDPNQIALYSHEVIWIVVGSGNPPANALPNINFWTKW